jgi:TPR repeat protein
MYYEGKGVSPDPVQAYAWISMAMKYFLGDYYMGYSDYQSTLVEIEYSMTPEQLEQANVLLTSWGDKYKPAE